MIVNTLYGYTCWVDTIDIPYSTFLACTKSEYQDTPLIKKRQ